MWAILFTYGFDSNTGERYLDTFYCVNLDELEKEAASRVILNNYPKSVLTDEVSRLAGLMNIRSRVQGTSSVLVILSEVEWTRDIFETWFLTTPLEEVLKRCSKHREVQ